MKALLKKRIVQVFLLILVVLGGAAMLGAFSDPWKTLEYTTATRGEFTLDVMVRGELRSERSRNIEVPTIRGRTQLVWLAPEGVPVQAGDVVARLDITDLENQLDQRKQEVETAQTNLSNFLASKPNQVRSAESSVTTAQLDLQLAEMQLQLSEFESVQQQEQRKISYESALLSLDNAKRQQSTTLAKIEKDEQRNRDRLEWALERQRDVENDIEISSLRAPIPGLLVYGETFGGPTEGMRKVRVGDSVHRGLPVAKIPDLSEILVDLKIPEGDYRKMKPDLPVELRIDAIQGPVFGAHLQTVAPLANYDSATRLSTFAAVAKLDSVDAAMRPGMTASVRIITDKLEDVLYIPNRAVFDQDGQTVVFPRKELPEPRVVHLGDRNLDYVVVQGGLEEGEEISLTDPRDLVKKEKSVSPIPGTGGGTTGKH